MKETPAILQRALDASHVGFALYEVFRAEAGEVGAFHLRFINSSGAAGEDPQRLLGSELREFSPMAADNGLLETMVQAVTTGRRQEIRVEVPDPTGVRVLDIAATMIDGELLMTTSHDVTEQVRGQRMLELAFDETSTMRALLQMALDATTDAFAVYGVRRDDELNFVGTHLLAINSAGAEPLGMTPDEMIGKDLRDFFPGAVVSGLWGAIVGAIEAGEARQHQVDLYDGDGQWIAAFDNTIAPSQEDRVVITWREATAVVRASRDLLALNDRVSHEATHDALTGLANRALFVSTLSEALVSQPSDSRTGVLFVDLDHFKEVNDTFGHLNGDRLLQTVATRLSALVRSGDCVARLGGDEFVIMLRNLPDVWSETAFVDRVLARLQEPVLLGADRVNPSASLGMALTPPGPPDVEGLLSLADTAMYESKRAGRGRGTVALSPGFTGP